MRRAAPLVGGHVLAAVFVSASVCAASPSCPIPRIDSTDYGDIERALRLRPPVITSVETFIDCLPDEFFEHGSLTYVTASRSPERASVSTEYPRTILFGETAETVIAYTGDPDGPFADEVRIIVNEDGEPPRYRFVSVTFPGSEGAPRIDESEDRCFACHRGHLIWGNYRDWPGTFGEHTDMEWQHRDRRQYDAFRSFLKTRADSPRYARGIARVQGDPRQARLDEAAFRPRYPYAPGAGSFLKKLVHGHARFVQGRLEQSDLYPFYRFLLAATFLGCDWNAEVDADFEDRVVSLFEGETVWNEYREYRRRLEQDPDATYYENLLSVSRLAMLGRVLGLPLDEWGTELTRSRSGQAVGPSFDMASGIEIRDYVFKSWIVDLGDEFEAIGEAFSGPKWSLESKYSTYLNPRYRHRAWPGRRDHDGECEVLLPYVEVEVGFREQAGEAAVCSRPADEWASRRLPLPASPANGITVPTSFARCAHCHRPGETIDNAPPIPTESGAELVEWLREGGELIRRRVLEDRDMPPEGLSTAELEQVREFLETY